MKQNTFLFVFVVLLSCLSHLCSAQQDEQQTAIPKWVSDKGYWVVESNIHTPKNSIVYFYNLNNVLVYKEKIEGLKIKLNKKKVLLRLKNVLEQSISAWEEKHIAKENEMLVAVALKY